MRIGLAGFGAIAEHGHLPALSALPCAEIVAVADLSAHRREVARALLPGAAVYEDPPQLLKRGDLDLLDVCTPPGTHADLIAAACRAGVPTVVSEKPFVLSEEEYLTVARARREHGTRIISVNNWMHSDLNRHVSAALRAGDVGAVRSVLLRTGRPAVARGNASWLPQWRTDPAHSGGGIILDHGWHQLYLLLGWMQRPVVAVRAATRIVDARHAPVEDEAIVDLDFDSAHARLELAWTAAERSNDGAIVGESGQIDIHDDRVVVRNQHGERAIPFNSRLTASSYHSEWFATMFRYNLVDKGREEADRNFSEAGALVSIIGAAYRSAREGGVSHRPVVPEEAPAGT